MSYIISPAPHVKFDDSVPKVMCLVLWALTPATLAGIYFFGWPALFVVLTCIITAVLTELVMNKIMKQEVTIADGSAVLTGLLLALTISPSMPLSECVIGTIFAIAIGKQLFGGLGYNIFNPALIGRAFLAAAFPVHMTTWTITSATPLALMKFSHQLTPYWNLFIGNVAGSVGETSALLLLLPALFLIKIGVIKWRIPVSYLGTVAIFGGIFWVVKPGLYPDPLFQLLSGGLMLGALFMATDYVTSPLTDKGKWIFGFGAGILVVIIRLFSGLPEGVMYSILFMNAFVPLINRYSRPRILGRGK